MSMSYYEIELGGENEEPTEWMCIKGVRQPSIEDATEFCKREVEKWGLPVRGIYPIDERTARSCYDFDNEGNWPVFGADVPPGRDTSAV